MENEAQLLTSWMSLGLLGRAWPGTCPDPIVHNILCFVDVNVHVEYTQEEYTHRKLYLNGKWNIYIVYKGNGKILIATHPSQLQASMQKWSCKFKNKKDRSTRKNGEAAMIKRMHHLRSDRGFPSAEAGHTEESWNNCRAFILVLASSWAEAPSLFPSNIYWRIS